MTVMIRRAAWSARQYNVRVLGPDSLIADMVAPAAAVCILLSRVLAAAPGHHHPGHHQSESAAPYGSVAEPPRRRVAKTQPVPFGR